MYMVLDSEINAERKHSVTPAHLATVITSNFTLTSTVEFRNGSHVRTRPITTKGLVIAQENRMFRASYQLLTGLTTDERDRLGLKDAID
jgi:hypothetical protein